MDLSRRLGRGMIANSGGVQETCFERAWYVVQTRMRMELLAVDELISRNFPSYCPVVMRKVRISSTKHREVKRPLFVGYVFVRFNQTFDMWEDIRSLTTVLRILMMGAHPVPIPEKVMDRVKSVEKAQRPKPITGLA